MAVLLSRPAARLRTASERAGSPRQGRLDGGFRYVWSRPDLKAILVMLFLIGTFGLNFPIFISTMAVSVFHTDARGFGLLSSIMAIGTVPGACSAQAAQPQFGSLLLGAAVFGSAARWPRSRRLLAVRGRARRHRRGRPDVHQHHQQPDAACDRAGHARRVMALRVGIALGGTPIGAPIVGWVADNLGPRWALGVGAASGFAAAIVAIRSDVGARLERLPRLIGGLKRWQGWLVRPAST